MARTRSSAASNDRGEMSLDAAMRAPSINAPDVVVLDFMPEEAKTRDMPDPKRDLWLSTVDGRYSSPIIPVRVGPHAETFPIHKAILLKAEYFRKSLCGEFKEAGDQAIDLPEEDPDIFSFVVAYLYEDKFVPLKALSSALVIEPDKGKGREANEDANSSSDDGSGDSLGSASDESARSQRRRENRRARQQRAWEEQSRKQPGRHRPDCACATCTLEAVGPPCWSCGAQRRSLPPRSRFPPGGLPPQPVIVGGGRPYPHPHPHPPRPRNRERERERRRAARNVPPPPTIDEPIIEYRMSEEDLRTWSLAYCLSIDVYVCAERYLMQDFKNCIAAFIINSFEVAGIEAAIPSVLNSCLTLYNGVSPMDPLLKKVFARVGFLQARLWKNFQEETHEFFAENPELAFLIMKEMVERREEDLRGSMYKDDLPAMERPPPFPPMEEIFVQGPRPRRDPYW